MLAHLVKVGRVSDEKKRLLSEGNGSTVFFSRWIAVNKKIPVRLRLEKKQCINHESLYPKLKQTFSQKTDVIAIQVSFWDNQRFQEGKLTSGFDGFPTINHLRTEIMVESP